jgi:enoyl-CoA hydratase/carnithine racemase
MNTNNEVIRSEVDADGIALLTIDYPGKTMNVIDQAFIDSLHAGIDRVVRCQPSRAPSSPRARRPSSPAPT